MDRVLSFFLSLITSFSLIFSPQVSKPVLPPIPTPTPTIVISQLSKKIAYIHNKSLRTSDINGKDQVEISSGANSYPGLAWKNNHEVSVIECTSSCQIVSYDLNFAPPRKTIDVGSTDIGEETKILSFSWNHTGSVLAYIYSLADGQIRIDLKSSSQKNTIKNIAQSFDTRDRNENDDISIAFSNDDQYILATYTLNQPNDKDDNTIWVFDNSGKESLSIESPPDRLATQARWTYLDDVFLYKQNGQLFSRTLSKKNSALKYSNFLTGNNPQPLPKSDGIIFWEKNKVPTIYKVAATTKSKIIDGFVFPKIVDSNLILAIQITPSEGLYLINTETKTSTLIQEGKISLYVASP